MIEQKENLRAFAKHFGKRVREARIASRVTQEHLANMVDSTRNNIVRLEAGKATYMPAKRALEICKALNLDLREIWRELNG
jgi:DNA-binding XRE family transcriptional regulator